MSNPDQERSYLRIGNSPDEEEKIVPNQRNTSSQKKQQGILETPVRHSRLTSGHKSGASSNQRSGKIVVSNGVEVPTLDMEKVLSPERAQQPDQ